MRVRIAISAIALGLLTVKGAFAQSQAESSLAEALYRQGRQLMAEGKVAEACPKFAESHRLDPATGTLLNLATCHEGERKWASAWLEYSEALTLARHDHRDDRVRFAQARLAELEPKLSFIRVVLSPGAVGPEIETELDGTAVRGPARNVPLPVDPGEHVVEARARGRKAWSERVSIDRDSVNVTVTVPPLESENAAIPAPDHGVIAVSTGARPIPDAVYVAGAVTLGLASGAVVTGVVYADRYARYGNVQEEAKASQTHGWGVANAILTGGALVGAGTTLYLYWKRPEIPAPPSTARTQRVIVPWVEASGAGVFLEGSF
jgi:hypothetical protein